MMFNQETGLPIKQECAPDIHHDLAMIRKLENESGTLQDLQDRDIVAAWTRLAELRSVVISPAATDEARDRTIETGKALMGIMEEITFIRLNKIIKVVVDSHESGPAHNPGPMLTREKELVKALDTVIMAYLTESGFGQTSEGWKVSMSKAKAQQGVQA